MVMVESHLSFIFRSSQEALLVNNAIPYNVDTVDSASLRSSNRSPVSVNETFWVPTISNPRHPSTHSDVIATTSTTGPTHEIHLVVSSWNRQITFVMN